MKLVEVLKLVRNLMEGDGAYKFVCPSLNMIRGFGVTWKDINDAREFIAKELDGSYTYDIFLNNNGMYPHEMYSSLSREEIIQLRVDWLTVLIDRLEVEGK